MISFCGSETTIKYFVVDPNTGLHFFRLFQCPRGAHHPDSFFPAEYKHLSHFFQARRDFPNIYVRDLKFTLNGCFYSCVKAENNTQFQCIAWVKGSSMNIFNAYIQFRNSYMYIRYSIFLTSLTGTFASFPNKDTVIESIKGFLYTEGSNSLLISYDVKVYCEVNLVRLNNIEKLLQT